MKHNGLVKRVLAKLSKPTLGSFYILEGVIYYSTINDGLEHKKLWKIIVDRVFKDLPEEDKKKLYTFNYGADRGRVTWIKNEDTGYKVYLIEGTPNCSKYEKLIKSTFGLNDLDNVDVDWDSSLVYITTREDKEGIKKYLDRYSPPLQDLHIATIKLDSFKK